MSNQDIFKYDDLDLQTHPTYYQGASSYQIFYFIPLTADAGGKNILIDQISFMLHVLGEKLQLQRM